MSKEFIIVGLISLIFFAVANYFIIKDVKKLKGKSKEEIQQYIDKKLDNASTGTILKNVLKFFSDLFF